MNLLKAILLCLVLSICCGALTCFAAETGTGVDAVNEADRDWTELDEGQEEIKVRDPIEPINRGIFWFNDKLYFYLFKPVARGYRAVVPEPGRKAVGNVFTNLKSPVTIVNSLLQLKLDNALKELAKFLSNSIFGLGGIIDLHADTEQQPTEEDFGQTLGYYGIGTGFYLVLPVFGPSDLRDGVGLFADRLVEPIPSPYYLKMHNYEVWTLEAYDKINWLSLDKDTYESIKKEQLDPYLFIRNAYMQKRAAAVDK